MWSYNTSYTQNVANVNWDSILEELGNRQRPFSHTFALTSLVLLLGSVLWCKVECKQLLIEYLVENISIEVGNRVYRKYVEIQP